MFKRTILPILAALVFAPLQSIAEPQSQILPENYQLILILSEGTQPARELSVVTATPDFRAESTDSALVFSGTLTPLQDGAVLVRYNVDSNLVSSASDGKAAEVVQQKPNIAQGSVKLWSNEPVQVLKSGTRTLRLMVSTAFRVRFAAYDGQSGNPDKMSFQIFVPNARTASTFLPLGAAIERTKLRIQKFESKVHRVGSIEQDMSELTLCNTETGASIVLPLGKVVDVSPALMPKQF